LASIAGGTKVSSKLSALENMLTKEDVVMGKNCLEETKKKNEYVPKGCNWKTRTLEGRVGRCKNNYLERPDGCL
jgi:hypothetical protein